MEIQIQPGVYVAYKNRIHFLLIKLFQGRINMIIPAAVSYTHLDVYKRQILIDNTAGESRQVIKESTAFLLTDAMVDVVTSGTGTSVNFGGMSIAGKTGTTSDYNDVWFAGYTPYYTCTTWTGYDNNAKLSGKNGERNLRCV